MEQMAYVKRIRDLREDHDYTQEQIAQFLGTSQTMYARYERAANELPIHHLLTCLLYTSLARRFSSFEKKREERESTNQKRGSFLVRV